MKARLLKLLAPLLLCLGCLAFAAESPVAPDQRRGVEQTFLTYPEWFLVHSPAEYATYAAGHPPHGFPFIGHSRQIWSSYASVTGEQLRAHYPLNPGYHVMILVIAGSTTAEYAVRWAYENTIGRLSWAVSNGGLTEEDKYGAKAAQEYVDFIRKEPWYLFDFTARLKGLWSDTPAFGHNFIRKWERRYALTSEYAVKAVYGKLIEWATRAAYEPALMTTQVVVDHAPDNLPAQVSKVRSLPDGRTVLDLPRYYGFRIAATRLAEAGANLQDIAGNTSVILLTLWLNNDQPLPPGQQRILFEQPLLTMPGKKRVALVLPVEQLSPFLLYATTHGVTVEHVYDY